MVIRPFKCEICDFSSSKKNNLKTHVESVHEGNKPLKKIICEICENRFSQKNDLKRHVGAVHKGNKTKDRINRYLALLN